MPSMRLAPLLAIALLATGCAPAARTEPAMPSPMPRTRPSPGAVRVQPRAGGVIDFALSRGDTTVALRLGDGAEISAAPRVDVRFSREALRRLVHDLEALGAAEMPADSSRYMWGVEIDDARGDLALHVTRVTRRARGAELRDSFALAARAGAEPLVIPLTATEFNDFEGLAHSYLEYLALLPSEPPGPGGRPHYDFEVDEPVWPSGGGCFPRYPEALLRQGVTGEVKARFIVGVDGRVEPGSWQAVASTHPHFAREVRLAASCFRYRPARVGGQPVRAIVQQPFTFDIARDDY